MFRDLLKKVDIVVGCQEKLQVIQKNFGLKY